MRTGILLAALVAAIAAWAAVPAGAWHGPGHDRAARAALSAAAATKDLPAFLSAGVETVAHLAVDPDNFTRPMAAKALHDAEAPEHYFDLERLEGITVSDNRYAFLEQLFARKLKVKDVGLLPYAVTEWTGRLTVALAEHRRWPDDPVIKQKCLVYAGILAHYAADLCQPLHSTIHYNGRVGPDGKAAGRGIHLKVDAALGKLAAGPAGPPDGPPPAAFDRLFEQVLAELKRSHALVDRVYELEKDWPAYAEPLKADSPVEPFLRERLAATARFTASLYLTAWKDSATVRLPEWHHRPPRTPDQFAPAGPPSASQPAD